MFLKTKKHLGFLLGLLIFFVAIAVLSAGFAFGANLEIAYADDTTEPADPSNDMIYWGVTRGDNSNNYNKLILGSDSQDIIGISNATGTDGEEIVLSGSIQATSTQVPWNDLAHSYANVLFSTVEIKSVIKPKHMTRWFYYCDNATSIDLSNLDTSNTVDMSGLFSGCSNLTTLDLSGFDTKNVTDMSGMFKSCYELTALDLSNFDTSNVTNMSEMFRSCESLTTLNISSFNTSNVTNTSEMFRNCENLTMLDLSNFDTANATDISGMFRGCSSLTSLDLTNFDTSNVTNISKTFSNCESLTTLDLSSFDTVNVTDMSELFCYGGSLTALDLSGFDTSKVTNMREMFRDCVSLTTLDLTSFDTANVTDMGWMFCNCVSLTTLDLSSFDTANVTDMSYMFANCSNLRNIDISGFDTANVTIMYFMFDGCSNLASIDVANFDLSKVELINALFRGCALLKEIDLSKAFVNGSTPANAPSMFDGCSAIEYINLSGMSIASGASGLLDGCVNLKEFVAPDLGDSAQTITLPAVFWDGSNDIDVATSSNGGMTLVRHDNHDIERHEYKAPTCEVDGNIEYYTCAICGKHFADELGENEIEEISTVLNAIGHEWQEPTYTWNGKNCTAQRVCSHDGSHIESETAEASIETIEPATCTQGGKDKYTAEFANTAFATQTTQVDTSAVGHNYGEWQVVKEPSFDELGEEQRVCLRDSTHIESRQINKLFDYRWLIVIIVLSLIIVGEVVFLISHRVRASKKESKK